MRRLWLLSFCVTLAHLLNAVEGFSQNPAVSQNPAAETRVGCLMNGRDAGTFVLVDEITGARLTVTGTDLARFTAQGGSRVSLTGTLTQQSGVAVFQVATAQQTQEMCAPIAYSAEGQKFELGRARLGARAGMGMDPELIIVGAQAQLGPIFKEIWARPTAEFAFGEVTKIFSVNADFAYYLPFAGIGKDPRTRWNVYIGGGPAFTILNRDFEGFPNQPVDVDDDWESEVGVNFIFGAIQANGLFAELRAGAYNSPTVRVYIGYVFR